MQLDGMVRHKCCMPCYEINGTIQKRTSYCYIVFIAISKFTHTHHKQNDKRGTQNHEKLNCVDNVTSNTHGT